MGTILLVDDNKDIIDLLLPHFIKDGYKVDTANDGLEAINKFNSQYDLVLLDIMMPKVDGLEVCKYIREKSNVPIIMITAKNTDEDLIMGIDTGADDYIVKPFSPKQVIAKVKALLRRLEVNQDKRIIKINSLFINMDEYLIKINNKIIPFTKKEIEILYLMASHPKRVYSREVLLDTIWGDEYFGDIRTVDTHIKRLRAKIKLEEQCFDIKTVWGAGYKFEENN